MFTDLINSFSEALQFDFFLRALGVGTLLAIICSYIGTYIVIRKEVMITHSIANLSFLGAVIGVSLNLSVNISILIAGFLGVLLITALQNTNFFSRSSVIEFTAQLAMAGGVVALSSLQGVKIDVMQFLFGDILTISRQEVWFSVVLSVVIIAALFALRRPLTQIVLNQDLAKASGTSVSLVNLLYLLMIAATISIAIKIIGVILLSAFIIIPPNIAKLNSNSLGALKAWSGIWAVFGSVIGLFCSYAFDVPSGPMIVITLGGLMIIMTIIRKAKPQKLS